MEKKNTENFLTIDGLKIRYWASPGKSELKPSVVFFHGYSFSIDNWLKIGTLDLLSKEGYSVFAIDLPSGKASRSDKLRSDDRMASVSLLQKVFENLGIAKGAPNRSRIVLVGPSMGGGFALAYAMTHLENVAGLVLISPSMKSIDEDSLPKLKMPVLLVWGERDNVFPVEEYAKDLKRALAHSKLIILKGAGHAAYIDKTEEFHEILSDFLKEIFE